MLNSILSNFRISFGDEFFPTSITEKYTNFLYLKGYPIKSLEGYLLETIQNFDIPGLALQTLAINALGNVGNNFDSFDNFPETTINRNFPGTSSINDIVEGSVLNVTFKNSLFNWMFCYEMLRSYYKRTREVDMFYVSIVIMDSAEIPMVRFKFGDCFLSNMPGLSFSYNSTFNESKTFDAGFTFNTFDVDFLLPNFDLTKINL